MMKFLLIVLAATSLVAQETKFYLDAALQDAAERPPLPVVLQTFPTKELPHDYDVLTYDLQFDLVNVFHTNRSQRGRRKVEPNVNITFKLLEPRDVIALDMNGLEIDAVTMDDMAVGYDTNTTGKLTIRFGQTLDTGVTHKLTILYAVLHDDLGFNALSPEDMPDEALLYPQVFTFAEPEDARAFFPCHDTPADKALFTVTVRTPKNVRSTSNGLRISDLSDSDSTHVERWRQTEPMPTYLVVMNASMYVPYTQVYKRSATDSIIITNYQWGEDFKNDTFDVVKTFENVPRMFAMYERLFGRYPYASYGHTAIAPVNFGGMEHTSLTSIQRKWLKADAEIGVVHELGHQWLGDLVTCATWADLWLNEGGASYTEAMWMEELYGQTGYLTRMLQRRNTYMKKGLNEPAVYDTPMWMLFNDATTYCKGAWVYHMIRQSVGDSTFYRGMRSWLSTYGRTSKQTADFLAFWKSFVPNPPVSWETFFYQWLVQRGHPVLNIKIIKNDHKNGRFDYTFIIDQTQSVMNVPEAFEFPLRFRIASADSVYEDRAIITKRSQVVQYVNLFDGEVTIDPRFEVLCEIDTSVVTSVSDERSSDRTPSMHIVGAQPHQRSQSLQVLCEHGGQQGELRLVAIDGTDVYRTLVDADTSIINIPTAHLAAGIYVVQWTCGGVRISTPCAVAP